MSVEKVTESHIGPQSMNPVYVMLWCILVTDACDLFTWGEGTKGKLGHGEDTEENQPRVVEALMGQDIRMIACAAQHTVVVSSKCDCSTVLLLCCKT